MSRHTHCTILGDGGWGTALAIHLDRLGHRVVWWGAFPDYLRELNRRRVNRKYLPGIRLSHTIRIEPDLAKAVAGAELILLAVPSQYVRGVVHRLRSAALRRGAIIVSAAKGIEQQTLQRMSQVVREELGPVRAGVLSGPSIASQVAKAEPGSIVIAARDARTARAAQRILMGPRLRVYTSRDVVGVELGGALKNPIAIGAGVCDGLGLGANAKAALITRGIVEMARLGVAMGAQAHTFWGLSGLGDLITTCLDGRNRWLGEQLGRGRLLRAIMQGTPMVIEGIITARAAVALGRKYHVELPIIEQVNAILFRNRDPRNALQTLMLRTGKAEA